MDYKCTYKTINYIQAVVIPYIIYLKNWKLIIISSKPGFSALTQLPFGNGQFSVEGSCLVYIFSCFAASLASIHTWKWHPLFPRWEKKTKKAPSIANVLWGALSLLVKSYSSKIEDEMSHLPPNVMCACIIR